MLWEQERAQVVETSFPWWPEDELSPSGRKQCWEGAPLPLPRSKVRAPRVVLTQEERKAADFSCVQTLINLLL
jgi:hypothetical protein